MAADQAGDPAAAMWDGADYARMATLLSPAATALVDRLSDVSAGPVIDLAAGTGSVTVAAAGRGRRVDAVDLAPGLVAAGRARCDDLGLDTSWHVGRLEDLSTMTTLRDDYAAALSSFGMIFAADPVAALDATADRLRPGGAVLLSTWDADGYVAGMGRAMASVLPEQQRAPATAWIRWGRADLVRSWLERAGFVDVSLTPRTLPWEFPSAHAAVDFLFTASPGHVAGARGSVDGGAALREAVLDHLVDFARLRSAEEPVDVRAAYLVVSART